MSNKLKTNKRTSTAKEDNNFPNKLLNSISKSLNSDGRKRGIINNMISGVICVIIIFDAAYITKEQVVSFAGIIYCIWGMINNLILSNKIDKYKYLYVISFVMYIFLFAAFVAMFAYSTGSGGGNL